MDQGSAASQFTFDSNLYDIPLILTKSIEYFEKYDVYKEEGIFRISPSAIKLSALVEKWVQAEETGIAPVLDNEDPHTIAVMLKQYFRELPVPLLTLEYGDCFIIAGGVADDEAAVRSIKSAFALLPLRNLKVIMTLTKLLKKVASFSEVNKMVPSNLAIVFAPSLFRSTAVDIEIILKESKEANKLAERFILYAEEFFETKEWEDLMKQKEKEYQQKNGIVPSFVIPKKALPKPPSNTSTPAGSPQAPRSDPPTKAKNTADTPPVTSTATRGRGRGANRGGRPNIPPPSPSQRNPNPPKRGITGGRVIRGGRGRGGTSTGRSNLIQPAPSPNSWGEAPKPPRPATGVSFTSVLLHKFPRISLLDPTSKQFVTVGSRGDARLRLFTSSMTSVKSASDIFKPLWNGETIIFKFKTKLWFAEPDGSITTKVVPDTNKSCKFTIETNEEDRVAIRSVTNNSYVAVGPGNVLQLSEAPYFFQLCIKVSLKAPNNCFCTVNPNTHCISAITDTPQGSSAFSFLYVEKLNAICSLSSVVNQQMKYWTVDPDSGRLLVSDDNCGANSFFQVRFSKPKFITLRNRKKFAKLNNEDNSLCFGAADTCELELLPFSPPKRCPGTV